MHKFDLTNRTAIITGGAQGFGLDIAKKFLNSGAKVIIWDIDENKLIEASKNLNNPNLSYHLVDVSNFKNVKETVDKIIGHNKTFQEKQNLTKDESNKNDKEPEVPKEVLKRQ